MNIVFALPEINLSGGIKIALEYADWLQMQGHDVTCLYPRPRRLELRQLIKDLLKHRWRPATNLASSHLWNKKLRIVEGSSRNILTASDFPDADVVVATWWETVEWIDALPDIKGAKAYFVQDHEVFPNLPLERVRATYRAKNSKIVVSSWLAEMMRSHYGAASVIVENGVDLERFIPRAVSRTANEVGLVWSAAARKNSGMAVEAMMLARAHIPDLRAMIFGGEPCPHELRGLSWVRYYEKPVQSVIPELYSQCSVWLFPSFTEGFGLPILEALASGTPVIATQAGAAPELVDASNGRLIKCRSQDMASAIIEILTLPAHEWKTLSENARQTAATRDWKRSAREFEAAITAIGERV